MNIHEIKKANEAGDTVRSFSTIKHHGEVYVYRKPDATITDAHNNRVRSGKKHFIVYKFNPEDGSLNPQRDDVKQEIWRKI